MKKKALCLKGGGAKGYAQLQVLKALENGGKPLYQVYDLIAGTSVGAINSALISTGKFTMKELDEIYPEVLKKVFTKPWYRIKTPKYQRKYFKDVWGDLIGSNFKMGDAKTKLMLTSVDLVDDINHFFKSWHTEIAEERMIDIVCRSFAAPLYFGHIVDKKNKKVWSDGGVGNANLPLTEVKTQIESFLWYDFPNKGENKIEIDAVGCLYHDPNHKFSDVSKNRWLKQVLDFMNPLEGGLARVQSTNDQVRMMSYLSRHNNNIIFRFWDKEIPKKYDRLDGIKYLSMYKKYGIEMAKKPLLNSI